MKEILIKRLSFKEEIPTKDLDTAMLALFERAARECTITGQYDFILTLKPEDQSVPVHKTIVEVRFRQDSDFNQNNKEKLC